MQKFCKSSVKVVAQFSGVKKMSVFPDVRYCIYAAKIGSKKVTKKANVIYGKIKLAKPINLPTIQYIANHPQIYQSISYGSTLFGIM